MEKNYKPVANIIFYSVKTQSEKLTLVLLIHNFENSADPDQLASYEAN